jgi:hypothetical protein
MAEQGGAEVRRLHPLRVLPGGARPVPEEIWVAAIVLGSLGFLWLSRRGLGHDASHVHAGGTAALTFLAYYLIATAFVRLVAAQVAERSEGPLARAIAFFA